MLKNINWNGIGFRVKNEINQEQLQDYRERFKSFIREAGGVTSICHASGISQGSIKGIYGNKDRLPSPILVVRLIDSLKGSVPKKFNREYLRPDVTPIQWGRLDDKIKKLKRSR